METASFYHTTTPILKISNSKTCINSRMPSSGFRGLQSHALTSNRNPKLERFGDAVVAAKCSAWDSGFSPELEDEEEWMKVGRLRQNCKERKGMVELLECLEREAIQGEDQGREASDYNRRAQIFDKSSKVFQALKERTEPKPSQKS